MPVRCVPHFSGNFFVSDASWYGIVRIILDVSVGLLNITPCRFVVNGLRTCMVCYMVFVVLYLYPPVCQRVISDLCSTSRCNEFLHGRSQNATSGSGDAGRRRAYQLHSFRFLLFVFNCVIKWTTFLHFAEKISRFLACCMNQALLVWFSGYIEQAVRFPHHTLTIETVWWLGVLLPSQLNVHLGCTVCDMTSDMVLLFKLYRLS